MKRTMYALIISSLVIWLSGCVSTGPLGVTSNNGPTNLVGEASCTQIFFLARLGDCSYEAAKHNGNITTVHHTDSQITNYFIVLKEKTIVYGTK
jgi:hypothetical protein